jgi:hypothetical protein
MKKKIFQVPGRGFIETWMGVFQNISQIRACDAAMGFSSIGILLFLRVRSSTKFIGK